MRAGKVNYALAVGLVVVASLLCQEVQGNIRQVPPQGSVSKATSNAYQREVDYGAVEVTKGVANSRTVTKSNGGFQNGGTTSIANSNARSREVSLGGLDIGSTLTRSQTNTNGAVSKSIGHDLNIGKLGIGSSLSRDNLRNGIGLQRSQDGGVSLGLGFLNVDLSRNTPKNTQQALTQAQVNAQGKNAQTKANSNAQTQSQQYGKVGVTETRSTSTAVGRTQHGTTSANTGGVAGGAATNAASASQPFRPLIPGLGYRPIRQAPAVAPAAAYRPVRQTVPVAYRPVAPAPVYRSQAVVPRPVAPAAVYRPVRQTVPVAYRPVAPAPVYRAQPQRQYGRPKRQAAFIPFLISNEDIDGEQHQELLRPKRQFQRPGAFGGFQQPSFGFQQPSFGFGGFQNQNANAQGIANNKANGFEQQAGANTHSNNRVNQNGFFQDNGASSIGSNIKADGTRGQVSSSNVAQMNEKTNAGSTSSNNAQSQSLNFDPNQQQASSSNAGTKHTQTAGSERLEAVGGSQVTNNNKFGTSTNIANTNSAVFQEGDRRGSQSDASSQSIFQGANGQSSGALTNSQTSSIRGPNGSVTNSASSSSSATSQGGGPANAVASASSQSGGRGGAGGATTNSQAGAGGGAGGASANSATNSGGFNARPVTFRGKPHLGRHRHHTESEPILTARSNRTLKAVSKLLPLPSLRTSATETDDLNQVVDGSHEWTYQRYTTTIVNKSTEQFDEIDENERHGRTFDITGILDGLFNRCVYPCTLEAYQQNRCCVIVEQQACCPSQPVYPPPRPPRPHPHPPPVLLVPRPPMACCSTCPTHGYYGPPPCHGYGYGGGGVGGYGGDIGYPGYGSGYGGGYGMAYGGGYGTGYRGIFGGALGYGNSLLGTGRAIANNAVGWGNTVASNAGRVSIRVPSSSFG